MSALLQLKAAYENNGMTVEQIATDQELEVEAVKAGLMQISSKYRKDCGVEDPQKDDLNFNDDQLRDSNRVIYELMTSADDEHLRAKLAMYIRDDKKGRKDVVKGMQNNTFNILQFNEQMAKIREMRDCAIKQLKSA